MLKRILMFTLVLNLCPFFCGSFAFAFSDLDEEESSFNPINNSVRISEVSYAGEGCPMGTVLDDISPDNEVITFLFSAFQVSKGTNQLNPSFKKNCRFRFIIDAPSGWSHAVFSLNVQGYADLQAGLTGFQNMAYAYADGRGRNPLGKMKIQGPFADDYVRTEQIPTTELVWSACRQNRHEVTINSTIGIEVTGQTGKNAVGLMTMEVLENVLDQSQPGKLAQQMNIVWKKCPDSNSKKPVEKSFMAICPLQLTNKATGQVVRTLSIKARARQSERAIMKAERRAERRCQNRRSQRTGRDLACQFQKSQCQVLAL